MTLDSPDSAASPCIDVCRMHAQSGWCEGCARTLAEIAAWSTLEVPARRAVLAQLPARQRALTAWLKLVPSER